MQDLEVGDNVVEMADLGALRAQVQTHGQVIKDWGAQVDQLEIDITTNRALFMDGMESQIAECDTLTTRVKTQTYVTLL